MRIKPIIQCPPLTKDSAAGRPSEFGRPLVCRSRARLPTGSNHVTSWSHHSILTGCVNLTPLYCVAPTVCRRFFTVRLTFLQLFDTSQTSVNLKPYCGAVELSGGVSGDNCTVVQTVKDNVNISDDYWIDVPLDTEDKTIIEKRNQIESSFAIWQAVVHGRS